MAGPARRQCQRKGHGRKYRHGSAPSVPAACSSRDRSPLIDIRIAAPAAGHDITPQARRPPVQRNANTMPNGRPARPTMPPAPKVRQQQIAGDDRRQHTIGDGSRHRRRLAPEIPPRAATPRFPHGVAPSVAGLRRPALTAGLPSTRPRDLGTQVVGLTRT